MRSYGSRWRGRVAEEQDMDEFGKNCVTTFEQQISASRSRCSSSSFCEWLMQWRVPWRGLEGRGGEQALKFSGLQEPRTWNQVLR